MLKHFTNSKLTDVIGAAAFGRLCVETLNSWELKLSQSRQPPSGGCVLKHFVLHAHKHHIVQPPSGGCVLKLPYSGRNRHFVMQPPSGGCVLKLILLAFSCLVRLQPPSGGCALKQNSINLNSIIFIFLLYLSTQFIPNNIPPLYFPLIRSRLCPIFSFHDLQLCVFLTFILTYLMS